MRSRCFFFFFSGPTILSKLWRKLKKRKLGTKNSCLWTIITLLQLSRDFFHFLLWPFFCLFFSFGFFFFYYHMFLVLFFLLCFLSFFWYFSFLFVFWVCSAFFFNMFFFFIFFFLFVFWSKFIQTTFSIFSFFFSIKHHERKLNFLCSSTFSSPNQTNP